MSNIGITSVKLEATADLGTAKFQVQFDGATAAASCNLQIFVHRTYHLPDNETLSDWPMLIAKDINGSNLEIEIEPESLITKTFSTSDMGIGVYDAAKICLFASSSNFQAPLYHGFVTGLNLEITTNQIRVLAPRLEVDIDNAKIPDADGNTIAIPFTVKWPQLHSVENNSFWAIAKSEQGFVQPWINTSEPQIASGEDDYYYQTGTFDLAVDKSDNRTIHFGLFSNGMWQQALTWIYPSYVFDIGTSGWEFNCPKTILPPRLTVRDNTWTHTITGEHFEFYAEAPEALKAVHFVRGGNYGNAVLWTETPLYNTPGFFADLKAKGLRWIRMNFDPDLFLNDSTYVDVIDQIVQNMLLGGLYPIVGPQDIPTGLGDTTTEQFDLLMNLNEIMATRFKGLPVWLNVCNEPSVLPEWQHCKLIMAECVRTIRAVDPNAFVIVPVNGFSRGSTSALAADPITDVHVDLYDFHAYDNVQLITEYLTPALQAGLPMLVGEYGSLDPKHIQAIHTTLQTLSICYNSLMAAGPWAFTCTAQDPLPLIIDASTPEIKWTPAGDQVIADYAAWNAGQMIPTDGAETIKVLISEHGVQSINKLNGVVNIVGDGPINIAPDANGNIHVIFNGAIFTPEQVQALVQPMVPTESQMRAVAVNALNSRLAYEREQLIKALGALQDSTIGKDDLIKILQSLT